MDQTFLTSINIKKVRHLQDIVIPLSPDYRKNLILTGKNGSGKTSVLEALKQHIEYIVSNNYRTEEEICQYVDSFKKQLLNYDNSENSRINRAKNSQYLKQWLEYLEHWRSGAIAGCTSYAMLREKYNQGKFVLAYYAADRKSCVEISSNIERVDLAEKYTLQENPGQKLVKYLVNLKTTQAFALQQQNEQRAKEIENWFDRFQDILRDVFEDPSLELVFNIETFEFTIHEQGREPFDFNTMSSGYAAVFDIINDLIIRMESQKTYDLEGVVLIDEIETHLHLELQKQILPILTKLFPNLQFIVSTHSPFILSSLQNTVIFDLESKTLVSNGLAKLPYEGIVEGYFGAETASNEVSQRFTRYRELIQQENLSDEESAEIEKLECYLDEVPDFLAPKFAAEYNRLKLEYENRG